MPKNKRPVPRKSAASPEELDDAVTQILSELAIAIVEQEDSESMSDALKEKEREFHKIIKKCLQQKKDDILYEAIDRTKYEDSSAYQFLKETVEEAAEIVLIRREEGSSLEVNAFVIPVFVHTNGGLHEDQSFQDQDAFLALTDSFKEAQLESKDATVVIVSHAYHLDEIDSIAYSQLNEMVRDAAASMTGKKVGATPAIETSVSGWPENVFTPEDPAVELRFLLGFVLKAVDDPFYRIPDDEGAADAYFDARAERFERWSEQVTPLVKRSFVTDDTEIELHFLYQDLFHGGKERGMAEYFMLQMMSELNQGLDQHGVAPDQVRGVIGPAEVRDEVVLRVNLYALQGDALIASADKSLGAAGDLQVELLDAYDALMTMGVKSMDVAAKFDAYGTPVDVRPLET